MKLYSCSSSGHCSSLLKSLILHSRLLLEFHWLLGELNALHDSSRAVNSY